MNPLPPLSADGIRKRLVRIQRKRECLDAEERQIRSRCCHQWKNVPLGMSDFYWQCTVCGIDKFEANRLAKVYEVCS